MGWEDKPGAEGAMSGRTALERLAVMLLKVSKHGLRICSQGFCVLSLCPNLVQPPVSLVVEGN